MKKWTRKYKKNPKRRFIVSWISNKSSIKKNFQEFYDRIGILINSIMIANGGIQITVRENTFRELLRGVGELYKLSHKVLLKNTAFTGHIGYSFIQIMPVLYFLSKALLNWIKIKIYIPPLNYWSRNMIHKWLLILKGSHAAVRSIRVT